MNTDAIKRFLTFLSSAVRVERGQLYQLVQSAEASCYLRDIQSQHELAIVLQSSAYPFNQIGKYYESIYLHRIGQHQKAIELLETVAELAPARYRSKALFSLGAVEAHLGHFEESLKLRLQTSSCEDPLTALEAQQGVAILRSLEGDHRAALRDLERLMPLAQFVGRRGHPAYITYLNSYALELSESHRAEDAEQVANVVAASPFIAKYPEWRETVAEIEAKRKRASMVAVPNELNLKYRDARVRAAVDFMKANYHRKIVLDELADLVNIGSTSFSNLFKAETGITPIDYLIRMRMGKARELLRISFLSVKQVMAAVGYNTKGHFTGHFKRQFGVTPSEYRKGFFHR